MYVMTLTGLDEVSESRDGMVSFQADSVASLHDLV